MSADILHGTWLPATQQFFVWGEALEPLRRKGRQAKAPPHPFQSPPDALRAHLSQADLEPAAFAERAQTVWLPAVAKAPVPSPELVATGALEMPAGEQQLQPWQVTGLLLGPDPAIDLLLALPAGHATATDLQSWRLATLLALHLVAGQQVLPGLR